MVRTAYVILTHTDPAHTARLVDALRPERAYLHVDLRSGDKLFGDMVQAIGATVKTLRRHPTPWGSWGLVAAEMDGMRAALQDGAEQIVVLSGADYPIVCPKALQEELEMLAGWSCIEGQPLPSQNWENGSLKRLERPWFRFGKGKRSLPIRRRLPPGIVPYGASQWKVLAAEHAAALIDVADNHPELVRFFARTLIPDELFVPCVLRSPSLVGGEVAAKILDRPLWVIRWPDRAGAWHPEWLSVDDVEVLAQASSAAPGRRRLFARKVSVSRDPELVEMIDVRLRLVGRHTE